MEPKTGKRIVSKEEDTKAQLKRAGLCFASVCLLATALYFTLATVFNFRCAVTVFQLSSIVEVGVIYYSGYWASRAIKKTIQLDPGVPLTRANTADLPAPESLVRASEEPMQAQEAVLLRAATQGQERHEEQLVRAVEGTE